MGRTGSRLAQRGKSAYSPGADHRRQADTGGQRPRRKAGAHSAAAPLKAIPLRRQARASAATPHAPSGAAQDAQSVNLPSTSAISSSSTTERAVVSMVSGYRSPAIGHILTLPYPEIAALITEPNEDGARLRQSSPFAGTLTTEERRRIYEAFRA